MNYRFQFQKRSQYCFGADDKTLSVAMRVHNPDRFPLDIESRDPAQAPTGFAKSVGDDFLVLHESDTLSRCS